MLPQNLICVLSQRRRRCPHAGRALRVLDRRVHQLNRPARAVLDLDDHVAREGVLVRERAQHVVDRRVRHALALEHGQPFFCCLGGGDLLDGCLELVAVGDAGGVDLEFGVVLPLRAAKAVAEDAEEPVVAAAEEDVAVFGLEGAVGDD